MPTEMRSRRGRRSRNLSVKSIIHIYTEGETEEKYFKKLRSNESFRKKTNLSVKSFSKGKQGLKLVNVVQKEVSRIKGEKRPDKIYIIFDKDNLSTKEIKACINQISNLPNTFIGFSNPSFEVWLLSHFKALNSFQTQHQLETELTACLNSVYKKADVNQLDIIVEHLENAHNNCANFSTISNTNISINPYTNISLVINDILQ